MALQTSHKWMIVIGAIIVLALIAYLIYRLIPKSEGGGAPPVDTVNTNPGVLTALQQAYCKLFPNSKICGGQGNNNYVTSGCDPNRPGYNNDGLYDNNCQ